MNPARVELIRARLAVAAGALRERQTRRGVPAHRNTMRSVYIGGCGVAALFTLPPGRLPGSLWSAL